MARAVGFHFALTAAALALAPIAATAQAKPAITTAVDGVREGQVYDISPFSLTVRAEREARIVALRLVNGLGEAQTIDVAPYSSADRMFEVELPVLIPHGYRLFWRVRDARGEEGEGSVGFVVRGCEDERGRRAPPRSPAF